MIYIRPITDLTLEIDARHKIINKNGWYPIADPKAKIRGTYLLKKGRIIIKVIQ